MPWTVIYKTEDGMKSLVLLASHDRKKSLLKAQEQVKGEVIALLPGNFAPSVVFPEDYRD